MKVLFVCHRFPFPPKRGGKIRPFNIIRHLSQSAQVYVASLVRDDVEGAEAAGISEHCTEHFMARVRSAPQWARMIARLPTSEPSSFGYFQSSALQRRIDTWTTTHRFDLVFVHCSSVAHYVLGRPTGPKVLDFGDMDSQKWLEYADYKPWPWSMGYRLEGMKVERAERRLASRFDLCTATTRGELETLDAMGTAKASDWFPNGVDATYFSPGHEPHDPKLISFIGRMDYFPNQEGVRRFCSEVFPRIRQQEPESRFIVVGADPSPEIRALAELPGVEITGSVPDVRPFIRGSAAMVAPLKIARGTQNKILEAMAMGVPVVTSGAAAKGVDAVPGEHFLVADDAEATAAALLRLMRDPAERGRLAQAGRARMLENHSWDRSMGKLDGILERVLKAGRN